MMFASGWTLADVLDLTWEQVNVVGRCVVSYKSEQANMILTAVSTALGGKVKPPKGKAARAERLQQAAAQRDAGNPSEQPRKGADVADRLAAMGMAVDVAR